MLWTNNLESAQAEKSNYLIYKINENQIHPILCRIGAYRMQRNLLRSVFKDKPERNVERLRRGTDRAEY